MDDGWLIRFAEACSLQDEGSILEAVGDLLGQDGIVASWRPGRSGWEPSGGSPAELPADVPAPGEPLIDGDRAVLHVGEDPTSSRVVLVRAPGVAADWLGSIARLVGVSLERVVANEIAAYTRRRLADNERIGRLGSYDWHVPTDTNWWSDELYRIYGEVPQSFNASYERFMEFIHPDDRDKVRAIHEHAFATGEPYEMEERIVLRDGTERLLWSNGEVIPGEDGTPDRFIGICRDVTDERLAEQVATQAEHHRQLVHDAEVRRRAALELNDAVVQGLSTAAWALDVEALDVARKMVEGTLQRARQVMNDLLEGPDGPPEAGGLRRTQPPPPQLTPELTGALSRAVTPPTLPDGAPRLRVVIADDAADLRELVELQLTLIGVDVVGVGTNGEEAVDLVRALGPDVVLLDLSMPVMDGLEATKLIREEHRDMRIVVLSGYAAATMQDQCRRAGADAYVEKGGNLQARLAAALQLQRT